MDIYWLRNILFRFIIQVLQRQNIKNKVSCSESLAFILSGILSGALLKNFAAHYLVVILVVRGNFLRLFQGHKCIPKQYACRAVCFCVDVLLD